MDYNNYMLINYGLPILGFVITFLAQIYVNNSYNTYRYQTLHKRKTGAEIARIILDNNGLQNIQITKIKGNLTDHYDPKKKIISLSEDIYCR